MKPGFSEVRFGRRGRQEIQGRMSLKSCGSFQRLLLPLLGWGRVLTLGIVDQPKFRSLVVSAWSICKTHVCVYFLNGPEVPETEGWRSKESAHLLMEEARNGASSLEQLQRL